MAKYDPKAFVTNERLDEAVQTILDGVAELIKDTKTELRQDMSEMKKELKGDIQDVRTEIKWMKNDIRDSKADTPTQSEFNKLKKRVDTYLA